MTKTGRCVARLDFSLLLFSLDATEAVLFSHAPMQMGDMAGMGGGDEEDMMGMMGGGAGGGMGGGMGVSLWPKCHAIQAVALLEKSVDHASGM